MYKGLSAFAGTHSSFPFKRFLRQFKAGPSKKALALMPFTFGWSPKIIEAFMLTEGRKLLEFHFGNGSGRRKGLLQKYEFLSGYSVQKLNEKLEKKDATLLALIEKKSKRFARWYKNIIGVSRNELLICPECEDNLPDTCFKILAKEITRTLKAEGLKFEIVRSPCTSGTKPADYFEKHGERLHGSSDRYIHNMDGLSVATTSSTFSDKISPEATRRLYLDARTRSCKAFFVWYAEHQGLEGKWLPPRKRVFKVTKEHLNLTSSIFK